MACMRCRAPDAAHAAPAAARAPHVAHADHRARVLHRRQPLRRRLERGDVQGVRREGRHPLVRRLRVCMRMCVSAVRGGGRSCQAPCYAQRPRAAAAGAREEGGGGCVGQARTSCGCWRDATSCCMSGGKAATTFSSAVSPACVIQLRAARARVSAGAQPAARTQLAAHAPGHARMRARTCLQGAAALWSPARRRWSAPRCPGLGGCTTRAGVQTAARAVGGK